MLSIGLIGKITSIEKQIEKLSKYPDIRIHGKSSVGTKHEPSEYRFSIPEYNRIELIERSDAIFLEDSALVPYSLLKDSIKRRKHIFFSEYPDFSEEQSLELIKLIDEAGTVVQIKNPLYFNSIVQCMAKKTSQPFYLAAEIILPTEEQYGQILWDIVLLLLKMGQAVPKKNKALNISHRSKKYNFRNIRLEFTDSSALEMNITYPAENKKFTLKVVSGEDIFDMNIISNQVHSKLSTANIKTDFIKEYESFFKSVIKKQPPLTGINEYLTALRTIQDIRSKINDAST